MNMHPDYPGHRRHRLGLSLVEVLVATAAGAVLMVAIATGLFTALNVTNGNMQSLQAQQAGRVALNVLTTKVRQANEVHLDASASAYPSAIVQVDVPDLTLVNYHYDTTTNGYDTSIQTIYHYHFDSVNQQLQLTVNDPVTGTTGPVTILGSTSSLRVSDLHFIATPEDDTLNDAVHPFKYRYVTIKMTLATNPGTSRQVLTQLEGSVYSRLLNIGN